MESTKNVNCVKFPYNELVVRVYTNKFNAFSCKVVDTRSMVEDFPNASC